MTLCRRSGCRALLVAFSAVCALSALANAEMKPGTYSFSSAFAGLCLDLPSGEINGSEGHMQAYNCNTSLYQHFKVASDPERPGRFLISSVVAGDKYLGIEGNSKDDGKEVRFQKRSDTAFQSWRIEDAGDGFVILINDGSGLVMDVRAQGNPKPGATIQQRPKTGVKNQKWKMDAHG